ncbi:DNA replication complex GINS protein PSF3 [Gracilariopsis chorda]|uniref:DNA replication complex GINS protein PSF3 n=1 Tax=Gracilariopsis chorda TaxID=448386 RepID=A0A2V3JA98_9FLOR|nr:DNA replication complex GINS protein PSF3 [Gracilariopsis chorda]|eukprot:PXF49660.1 DNA replication complex GINS protein PSF3 [Gracilariopsis chorda]
MEDYFSIDDILAGNHCISTTFEEQGFLLGHLDPENVMDWNANNCNPDDYDNDPDLDRHMPKGMTVALPYWLAEALAARNFAKVQLPRCYGKSTRQALRADARSVDLRSKCDNYYALGVRLARLLVGDDVTFPGVLLRAFAARCWSIADMAVFSGDRGAHAMKGFDLLECDLFCDIHGIAVATRRWKERRGDRISGSGAHFRKRPREEIGSPVTPSTRPRTS